MNLVAKQKQAHRLREQIYGCQDGRMGARESKGVWDGHVHTAKFKMNSQQVPTAQHRELCSTLRGILDGREVWGRMDTCACMAESLCRPPETITALLISYTLI